jgi:amino acid transporter
MRRWVTWAALCAAALASIATSQREVEDLCFDGDVGDFTLTDAAPAIGQDLAIEVVDGYAELDVTFTLLYVAGAGYWSLIPEATISGFFLWPNMLAVAMAASPLVVLLIGLGYILNSHQIVHNCYIGVTRIMVAMSLDRVLPEWVSRVHDRLHTPVNAHLVYFLASIPVILAYNLVPGWVGLTLGVTFGGGYVFVLSCLSGALLPKKAKAVYDASPGARYMVSGPLGVLFIVVGAAAFIWASWVFAGNFPIAPIVWLIRLAAVLATLWVLSTFRDDLPQWVGGKPMPWVTAVGLLGSGFGFLMVEAFLLAPELGVLGNWNFADFPSGLWAQIIAFGIILISAVWYALAKSSRRSSGINVDFAFKEIPPE